MSEEKYELRIQCPTCKKFIWIYLKKEVLKNKKIMLKKKMTKIIRELIYDIIEGAMCESYDENYIQEKSKDICDTIAEWIIRKQFVADVKSHMNIKPLTIDDILAELKK